MIKLNKYNNKLVAIYEELDDLIGKLEEKRDFPVWRPYVCGLAVFRWRLRGIVLLFGFRSVRLHFPTSRKRENV